MVRVKCLCRSHGLEGTKRPLDRLLLLFNRQNTDDRQIQTKSEISSSTICNEACPTQWRVACTKPLENLTFSDNSDSDAHGQQEGDNVDRDPTFLASFPHLNPIYENKDISATLSVIWICLKNKVNSLVPDWKGGIFSTEILNDVTFAIATMNSHNFSPKRRFGIL